MATLPPRSLCLLARNILDLEDYPDEDKPCRLLGPIGLVRFPHTVYRTVPSILIPGSRSFKLLWVYLPSYLLFTKGTERPQSGHGKYGLYFNEFFLRLDRLTTHAMLRSGYLMYQSRLWARCLYTA